MAKVASKNAKVKDLKAAAEAKNWTKVIKAVRSPKTGAYTFKEQIIHKDLRMIAKKKKLKNYILSIKILMSLAALQKFMETKFIIVMILQLKKKIPPKKMTG